MKIIFTIAIGVIFLITPYSTFGQSLTLKDSIQIISRSERLILDFQRLLNTLSTASQEEANQAIINSYNSNAGLRYIFLNANIIVEYDLDSSYYQNKIKNKFIDGYLIDYWNKHVDAGKQITYLSSIIFDTLEFQGDSVITTVYFNSFFDSKPFVLNKRRAHITGKKINNEWTLVIYEILFSKIDDKSILISKFKSDIKTSSNFSRISEEQPFFYSAYKKLNDWSALPAETYKSINSELISAELSYSKFYYEDAHKKYNNVLLKGERTDFIEKRIENSRVLSSDVMIGIDSLISGYNSSIEQRAFYMAALYLEKAERSQPNNGLIRKLRKEHNETFSEYNLVKNEYQSNPAGFLKFAGARLPDNKDFADIYYYFIGLSYQEKNTDSALMFFSKCLSLKPLFKEARIANAKSLIRNKQCDKAQIETALLLKENSQNDTIMGMHGDALYCSGNKREAINMYSEAIALNNREYVYYYQRGLTYFDLANLDLAIEDLKYSTVINPKFSDGYWGLFKIYYAKGNDSCLYYLDEAVKAGLGEEKKAWCIKESKKKFSQGTDLFARGAKKESEEYFKYAAHLDDSNSEAWYQFARIDSSVNKNFNHAVSSMAFALKRSPSNTKYLLFTGHVQMADSNFDAAIATFEIIEKNKNDEDTVILALEGIGDCYAAKHMDSRAQSYYKNALDIKWKIPVAFKLGNNYLYGFNYDEAIKIYKSIISKWTTANDMAYFQIGLCNEGKKEFKDAIDNYEKVIEINSAYPEVNYRYGFCLKQVDNCKKAIEQFSKQLQLNPGDQKTFKELASCQYQLGNFSEAVKSYQFLTVKNEEIVLSDPLHCKQYSHVTLSDPKYFEDADKFIEYGENHYDIVYFKYLRGEFYYLTNNQSQYTTAKQYFKNQQDQNKGIIKDDPIFQKLIKSNPELKVFNK